MWEQTEEAISDQRSVISYGVSTGGELKAIAEG
jgi:hypothetical protein